MCCVFIMQIFLLLITLGAAICSIGFCTDTSNIPCHDSERQALLNFKYGLTEPSNRLASWVEGGNCCDWYGVVCHNLTGHVRELHLRNPILWVFDDEDAERHQAYKRMALGGKINTSLLGLKHLHYLDLSNNDFGGIQIPKFFGSILSLRHLNLSFAGFGREIPYQLGNLTKLRYLDIGNELRYNSYTGNLQWLYGLSMLQYLDLSYVNLQNAIDRLQGPIAFPVLEELHLSWCGLYRIPLFYKVNSSNLVILDLSHNYISGSLPQSFAQLNHLKYLYLGWNSFYGVLSNSIGNLTSLIELNLSVNKFNGTIPEGLRQLIKLESLDLSGNQFNGTLSESLVQLMKLKSLDLSGNQFSGTLSKSLGQLMKLVFLDLSGNQFSGTPLESLGQLMKLKSLDLSGNQFSGTLPESLGQLMKLKFLYLSKNQFSGTLPESLGQLMKLKALDLFGNQFSGTLPESLGQLMKLESLDLSRNQFSGTLPKSLGQLMKLKFLYLSKIQFSETLSESLGQLMKLKLLYLSDNQFSGTLPESLGQLINLEYFYVDHNSLECVLSDVFFVNLTSLLVFSASKNSITSKVSPNWIPPSQLEAMFLSSWNLGPKFPKWLSSKNHLGYLDISNASIEDTIPNWFWKMSSQFSYVNLSHNELYGQVSDQITNRDLNEVGDHFVVDLSSNCFTGPLPRLSFRIYLLDLSYNSFSGPLSRLLCDETNEIKNLEFLLLGNNKLSGEIPDCWTSFPFLYSLELQNNNLVGALPSSMALSRQLTYLNLRSNTLSGVLPSSLQYFTELVALDLGENKLGRGFPRWIGQKLSKLRILSLRSNDFDGHIPNEICSLTLLIILDPAHNNLSGSIPKCVSNFSAMAYLSSFGFLFTYSTYLSTYVGEHEELASATLVLEYRNNLPLMAAIDLSSNSLSGWIPEEITNLVHLISLNLSRNCLTGKIPEKLGNMTSLESLDLSFNQISGEIPQSMRQMTFLEFLNLSYNNLRGRIPTSTQLQSFSVSSFIGNDLCGPPISDNCNKTNGSISSQQTKNMNHHRFDEFYVSILMGFVVGFGVVVGPLLCSRSWRFTYFLWLQSMWDTLWVRAVLLKRAAFGRQV